MNYITYCDKRTDLENKIAFNERLHCHRVASRWRRELKTLNDNNPEHEKYYENKRIQKG